MVFKCVSEVEVEVEEVMRAAAERWNPKEENRGGTLQSSNKTYHRYDVPERVDSNTAERRNPKEENRGGRCRSGISQQQILL